MNTILVVDDEPRNLKVLSLHLQQFGYQVLTAQGGEEAQQLLDQRTVNLVITDIRMPKVSGHELMRWVREYSPHTPVIVLTAYGSLEDAVAAMREGAVDYLTKPWEQEQLRLAVERALNLQHLRLENEYLWDQVRQERGYHKLVGQSQAMLQVFGMIERVAVTDSTVLLLGESGTGKELVAFAIHEQSERAEGPLVPINCIAMPEELLESELFGHVRGAFTGADRNHVGKFELAHGGTLFLDEIGDMSPRLQGKLLRALQERKIQPVGSNELKTVDVRIIAATNVDLEERVRAGTFRQDLFYRLSVVPITLPALREREGDVPLLLDHFLRRKSPGEPQLAIPASVVQRLENYQWPGNVRELENIVERAIVLGTGDLVALMGLSDKPADTAESTAGELAATRSIDALRDLPYRDAKSAVLARFEHDFFSDLLQRTGGNVSQAAELADMHRKNLHVKLQELGLDPRQYTKTAAEGEHG